MSIPSEIYKKIKPAVVAIVSKYSKSPDFPDIIGTGFIVDESGIILTNNHVINAINLLPRRKNDPTSIPIQVILFHNVPDLGMLTIHVDVEAVSNTIREKEIDGVHYGEDIPDIGAIYVKAKGLPFVEIDKALSVEEGDEVFISGFPMGTSTLKSAGWLHQFSPILQRGIVSAILPFVCESPHGIIVEAVTHGGSSGSPIFNPTNGKIVAILFAGFPETKILGKGENGKLITYTNSTSLTYAIPSPLLHIMYKKILRPTDPETGNEVIRNLDSYKTLEEIILTQKKIKREPKKISTDGYDVLGPDDFIKPNTI
ncbi:MAG: serine protease [Patescibacteria group bacterium]